MSSTRHDGRPQIVDGRELAPPDDVVPHRHEGSDPEQSRALEPRVRWTRQSPAVEFDQDRFGDPVADHAGPSHTDAIPDRRDVHLAVLRGPREWCTPEPGRSGVAEELVGSHDERDGGDELRETSSSGSVADAVDWDVEVPSTQSLGGDAGVDGVPHPERSFVPRIGKGSWCAHPRASDTRVGRAQSLTHLWRTTVAAPPVRDEPAPYAPERTSPTGHEASLWRVENDVS
ncbi:hypothetical protein GCM10009627_19370 [Curtobacterium herbarum]|uniref:Uncharacterized protein n=1 Tax=Curtobacterium herbarum TaxID=150122 RepID=A0ABP4K8B9_9MICO